MSRRAALAAIAAHWPLAGSRRRLVRLARILVTGIAAALGMTLCGCHHWSLDSLVPGRLAPPAAPPPIPVPVDNPAHVGPVDPDFLWRQIVDAVDDYFRIDVEQRVRRDNLNWLEGRLTTYPEVSGTSFEPWRSDTARGFERLQSTVQTIRRTATIRVVPEASGYLIDVHVLKEQEDVDQTQFATAGASAQRHDGTIVRHDHQLRPAPATLGWYEIGRDRDLERRIAESILGRITHVEPPPSKLFGGRH